MTTRTKRNIVGLSVVGVIVAVVAVLLLLAKHAELQGEKRLHVMEGGWRGFFESIPRPADDDNAGPLFLEVQAAHNALPDEVLRDLALWSEPADLRWAVEEAAQVIALAHAALAKPAFFIDIDFDSDDWVYVVQDLLLYTGAIRTSVKLLLAEARVAADRGDHNQAVSVLTQALNAYEHMLPYRNETVYFSLMFIESDTLDEFEDVGAKADAQSLRAFDAALAGRDWMSNVRDALLMHRALYVESSAPFGTRREMLRWLQLNREAIESLDKPYHLNPVPADLPEVYLTLLGLRQQAVHPLRKIQFAALAQARTSLARSAIALRLHYLEHGEYPEEYEPLVDPFTGAPLEYEKTETGFVLRSSGTDPRGGQLQWRWE